MLSGHHDATSIAPRSPSLESTSVKLLFQQRCAAQGITRGKKIIVPLRHFDELGRTMSIWLENVRNIPKLDKITLEYKTKHLEKRRQQ